MASKVNVTTAGEPRPLIVRFLNISTLHKHGQRSSSFLEIHEACNVGIFVLLKFENKSDAMIGHINFNAKHTDKVPDLAGNYFQFISTRNCTIKPTLPNLCISGKLE